MDQLHDRLRKARIKAGYEHASDFARANDLPEGTYRHHENGTRGVKYGALTRYAALLKVSPNYLLTGANQPSSDSVLPRSQPIINYSPATLQNGDARPPRFIPIIGELRAGMFQEEADASEPLGFIHDTTDERYAGLPRYGKRVIGPSMNNVIPPGSVAIFVSLQDLGRDPEHNEIVEVIRRDKRGFVESTVKRYVEIDGARYLMPDSTHPEHRQPIKLDDSGEDDSVIVRGLMIRAIIDF